jgi:hypothetical protein
MPKYHNRKTVLDGMTFDSAAEAARWRELTLLEKAGHIRDLQRQVPIELVPGARLHGEKRARPAIRLVVDFAYRADGERIYEDTKGMETPMSRAKRHMAKALHGIDVRLS